ncbi:CG14131 [Drosophila busckii]|uniref:CG14131 n=1 Tax=Drosophila busckii TaxID=30019 RepID=A0A0M4EZK6_DROBS|nr:uncharacterized protein LOC108599831 [Drosophila busckii]ALC43845.1 CG14131 [Drosophila busckii]
MAQLKQVGQGQLAALGPVFASLLMLMGLVFALLGIKFWGFRRRLTFDRGNQSSNRRSAQQQAAMPPRYAAYESQVNGTDHAVQGVFRQRNLEEFESAPSAGNKYLTGSVPNLRLAELPPLESSSSVAFRAQPQSMRRSRHKVHSANFDYYGEPPTRQPPVPPVQTLPAPVAETEPNSKLDMPNFDHFAEKYELVSAQPAVEQLKAPKSNVGNYLKYEQVDDVPEILTPDDEHAGAAISVAAVVHQATPVTPVTPIEQPLPLEHTDSAFVVEIIAGTPDTIERVDSPIGHQLFADLELTQHETQPEFRRTRSSYEMNEADILDIQTDFSDVPLPGSPPGFGKSIDDDWENFEDLHTVVELPEPNWLAHPQAEQLSSVETTLSEANLQLEHVVQQQSLFQQLELIEPQDVTIATEPEPPPYSAERPQLPDYESLMQLDSFQGKRNLPKYADVVSQDPANSARFVSSIEDLLEELRVSEVTPPAEQVRTFEQLYEELEPTNSPLPARRPPQPTPRITKPTTLNVRGNAPPLTCYTPEELGSSSASSEAEAEVETLVVAAPQPAKRAGRTLKVRFDVENLRYYQSAEVPSSNESEEEDFESASELSPQSPRNLDLAMPRLFATQISQEDSDEETFGRAIRQHRTMTDALPSILQLEHPTLIHKDTEA